MTPLALAIRDARPTVRAADLEDIDATIRHWRDRGVCATDAAHQLRLKRISVGPTTWAAVRRAMIAYLAIRGAGSDAEHDAARLAA